MAAVAENQAAPRVWVLSGPRAGDEAQVLGLAEALGWPFEVKRLEFDPKTSKRPIRLTGATLATLAKGADSLVPPWPDLVLAIGRRAAPVALWIKAQSGGRTKLVHLNRPRAPLSWFDLVVATPQYRMKPAPNLRRVTRPFHRVNASRLAEAKAHWAPVFEGLPRPWIALLAGGKAPPFRFNALIARSLGKMAAAEAKESGGSLLVTSSFRMRRSEEDALFEAIADVPHYGFRWRPGAEDNPYFGFLALADRFIVTGESVSMLCEAAETGKPVTMFPLPWDKGSGPARLERLYASPVLRPLLDWLDANGWLALPRDTRAVQEALLRSGAVRLPGENTSKTSADRDQSAEKVLREIKSLVPSVG